MLTGDLFIGGERRVSERRFTAHDPVRGQAIAAPQFAEATMADIADACARAETAFADYAARPLADRATFLEAIASRIEALGDALVERAAAETGLPTFRLQGERGRTAGQLRLFAREVLDGGWQQLRIDEADHGRVPPRPDLRLRTVPLGPVAVFGASNFPLAFSTAGGDTASALAAGCPVVVKGHPAHPGTSELVATAILAAIAECGMPSGLFSLLQGTSNDVGAALVADPRIMAVGFTGSRAGGSALMRIAASRPVPIPVYAEMSAVNPVLLLPAALRLRGAAIAAGYVGSLTLGAGQFCTNPGLVLGIAGPAFDAFLHEAGRLLAQVPAQPMLTANIHAAYQEGRRRLGSHPAVSHAADGLAADGPTSACAGLFRLSAADLLADPSLGHELFGATGIAVMCADIDEMLAVLHALEGQLTATIHVDAEDHPFARLLLPVLERKAGRILANGWPTGVEVTHAMVHGGPFPATSDGRSTSVGTLAIERFLRPVCYQDMPEDLLPEALRGMGAAGVPIRLNGARR